MKIKFVEDYDGQLTANKPYKAGSVVEVGAKEGQKLINRNRAVKVEEKKASRVKKAK